jgi:hypothetical protein
MGLWLELSVKPKAVLITVLHRKRSESYNLLIGKRDIKAHVDNVLYLIKTCNWFNKWYLWNINPVFINETL